MKKWSNGDPISELVLLNNHHYIILNKPAGLPSQEDKTKDISLIKLAEIYSKQKLFPVHRIDRPASGIMLFAKSKESAAHFSKALAEGKVKKTYIVACSETPGSEDGKLVHYLKKGKQNKMYVEKLASDKNKRAELQYKYLGKSAHYHFLEIQLITGRQHQIRAQFAACGCPIKGDVKYGARRKNPDRSIHLHSYSLKFASFPKGNTIELSAPFFQDPLWGFCAESILE